MSIETWKVVADLAQGFGVLGAAGLGGLWTRHLYLRQRENYPRASIEHELDVTDVGHGKVALRLAVTIRNRGKVLIEIERGLSRVQQFLPCDPKVISVLQEKSEKTYPKLNWILLGEKTREEWNIEIEPGDEEEVHFDFLIDSSVQKVSLYSHFDNRAKPNRLRPIGWNKTTMHCLRGRIHDARTKAAISDATNPSAQAGKTSRSRTQ